MTLFSTFFQFTQSLGIGNLLCIQKTQEIIVWLLSLWISDTVRRCRIGRQAFTSDIFLMINSFGAFTGNE